MYKCQNCKTPQGSKPDRRRRAQTEGISESRIRGHARDEHRLRVSWSQTGDQFKSATELLPISCPHCGKAFKRYHQGLKNHEKKCSLKPSEEDALDKERSKAEPPSKNRRYVKDRDKTLSNGADLQEPFPSTSKKVSSPKHSKEHESITREPTVPNSEQVGDDPSRLPLESSFRQGRVQHDAAQIPMVNVEQGR